MQTSDSQVIMQGIFILKWEIEMTYDLINSIDVIYVRLLSCFENVHVFETSFFESLFWLLLSILAFVD